VVTTKDRGRTQDPRRPTVDPRFARRWVEVRRQEGRRRLRWLIGAGGVALAVGLVAGALYSPLLAVRHVPVTLVAAPVPGPPGPAPGAGAAAPGAGAVAPGAASYPYPPPSYTTSLLRQWAGMAGRPPMIDVDAGRIEQRLDAQPWLGSARVEVRWPDTVSVSVVERTPLAALARPGGSGVALVDPTGRVLADVTAPPVGLPLIEGLGAPPAPGSWLLGTAGPRGPVGSTGADLAAAADAPDVPSGAAAALALVAALPAFLRADVLSVQAGPGTALQLVVAPPQAATGTVRVIVGDGSALAAKVAALVTILDQVDLAGVRTIDVSVPGRPTTS
jgi:hypothetical protein